MKKYIYLFLFCIFVGSSAQALSEVEFGGELDVNLALWNLPTGQRGDSAFQVPTLFLDFNSPLKNDNLLVLRLEGSEEQTSTTTERFAVKVREGYLDLVSIFRGMRALRIGLIPQVWQEAQYESYSYRYLGREAWGITEKWNYLAPSDMGLSFMSEMPADLGEYAISFANGEGVREKEQGPHKEFSLFMRFVFGEPWGLNLNYVRGGYERYGEENGTKERIQALLSYQKENAGAGLELLFTQDPAEAFADYNMAEGVDVSALSGSAVRGQGASLFTTFKTGPLAEMMLRYDYLNAAAGETGKDLKTALISLSYQVDADIRMAVMTDYTWYGEEFAPGVRDQSKIALATQVLF
jgi:hypothetical protein